MIKKTHIQTIFFQITHCITLCSSIKSKQIVTLNKLSLKNDIVCVSLVNVIMCLNLIREPNLLDDFYSYIYMMTEFNYFLIKIL